jgi:two-component system KDP operon response regulator KdpE
MEHISAFNTCPGASDPACKTCVLAVDDDVKILRFLRTSLKLSGYKVVTATSGEDAMDLIKSEKPDIMLLDILMPGIDGFEVLRRLRTTSKLPVIVISAHASAAEEALKLGANDFLTKPFMPDACIERIRSLLK